MKAEATAFAKVNLTLHVTGQRTDGYHLLDSLVVRTEVGDRVEVSEASELTLEVTGPFAPGVPRDEGNLVLRAARLLAPNRGALIRLEKNLPHAAGIGGGSADAATTLNLLSRLWELLIPAGVETLGADVPVCLSPHPQRMRGVGEVLNPVALPALPMVLVNPGTPVPTAPVFAALTRKDNPPMTELPEVVDRASLIDWLAAQRNDLEPPACAEVPQVAEVLAALRPFVDLARMSGSGGTCFGICPDPEAVAAEIARARPDWWIVATRSLSSLG
jgi:4-diphosphocytidyl-2-C-methyl-D-erythritol kinase